MGSSPRAAQSKSKPETRFVWKPNIWATKSELSHNVFLLSNRISANVFVVKKVIYIKVFGKLPLEVRIMSGLPVCNRVVKLLGYAHQDPDPDHGTAFFEYHPLGDLSEWKEAMFDCKNFKPVPESHIWRFFVQMSQALAFLHNELGPRRDERQCLLHRDLKPKNFLVVDNGTTYPSFRMHDFDMVITQSPESSQRKSRSGTFEWQPPENPMINTTSADVWSLGACVHYLAIGTPPIQNTLKFKVDTIKNSGGQHPAAVMEYTSPHRYYAARVPREVTPINLSQEEQRGRGIAPYTSNRAAYNHTYSDELNLWMQQTLEYDPKKRPCATRLVRAMSLEAKMLLKMMAGQAGLVDLEIAFEK